MIKTKKDNDVIDYIGLAYVEIKIKPSGPINLGVVYHENQIRQQYD